MRSILLALLTFLMTALPAAAQLNPLGNLGAGDEPMELESDEGLELHQDRQMVVARGNVVVRQGGVRLRADTVSASYKDIDGKRSIHRVDAVGGVVIQTEKERLTGHHAAYDLQRELFVMTGKNLRIEAEKQTVTAQESIEYWGKEKRAVARGDATAIQKADNTTIRADVIEAQLAPRDGPGAANAAVAKAAASPASTGGVPGPESLGLNSVRAWGQVVISTQSEIVQGDKGHYDATNRVATLEGNVRITRGKNQLNGEKAIVDLEKGVSRLIGTPGKRVRSVFYPGSAKADTAPVVSPGTPSAAKPVDASKAAVAPQTNAIGKNVVPRSRPGGQQ